MLLMWKMVVAAAELDDEQLQARHMCATGRRNLLHVVFMLPMWKMVVAAAEPYDEQLQARHMRTAGQCTLRLN
jgi:hypothetical protein